MSGNNQTTCRQCRYSIEAVTDDFTGTVLMCVTKLLPARKKCGRFEREPGTMEREDEDLPSL